MIFIRDKDGEFVSEVMGPVLSDEHRKWDSSKSRPFCHLNVCVLSELRQLIGR